MDSLNIRNGDKILVLLAEQKLLGSTEFVTSVSQQVGDCGLVNVEYDPFHLCKFFAHFKCCFYLFITFDFLYVFMSSVTPHLSLTSWTKDTGVR